MASAYTSRVSCAVLFQENSRDRASDRSRSRDRQPGSSTALDIAAGNGTLVSLGIVRATELDVLQVMRKNLTWVGVVASVRRHFAEAITLIQTRKVRPHELITHDLPLGDALAGFDALRQRGAVKVMFRVSA